jgi:hypothetical protein
MYVEVVDAIIASVSLLCFNVLRGTGTIPLTGVQDALNQSYSTTTFA